jgi:hypothetical protein
LVLLLAAVVLFAVADFLIGKTGRKQVQLKSEDWWLALQYVNIGTLGIEEARFFDRILKRLLGSRLFSWRRLFGCLAIYSIFETICCRYIE